MQSAVSSFKSEKQVLETLSEQCFDCQYHKLSIFVPYMYLFDCTCQCGFFY